MVYKFTKSVYDIWMPAYIKTLYSAIDATPADINFDLSEESDLQFPSTSRLSQGLESHRLSGVRSFQQRGAEPLRSPGSDTRNFCRPDDKTCGIQETKEEKRLGIYMAGELLEIEKIGLGQSHFNNIAVT